MTVVRFKLSLPPCVPSIALNKRCDQPPNYTRNQRAVVFTHAVEMCEASRTTKNQHGWRLGRRGTPASTRPVQQASWPLRWAMLTNVRPVTIIRGARHRLGEELFSLLNA